MKTIVLDNIDADKFKDWLDTARPGHRLMYHRGHLAYEREGIVVINEKVHHLYREPLHTLAAAVWQAYRRGQVLLTQGREDWNTFSYYATKRSKA